MQYLVSDILSGKIIRIFYQLSLYSYNHFNYLLRNLMKKLLGIMNMKKNDYLIILISDASYSNSYIIIKYFDYLFVYKVDRYYSNFPGVYF